MNPWELFIETTQNVEFKEAGDKVNWTVKVYDNEKKVRLIFEKTNGKHDWKNNFRFAAKVYKNQTSCIMASKGFAGCYKTANDKIMKDIISAHKEHPDYTVEITGWSRGGGMALIAAEDFYYRTKVKPNVITYGAPKVLFGKKTHKYILSCVNECHNYRHVCDLISYLPPFPGFRVIKKHNIGGRFNLFKLWNMWVYHAKYETKEWYLNKK